MIALLACAAAPPLDPERQAVRDAERPLILASATAALDQDRPADAARAVLLGLEVDRDTFLPLLDRLDEEPAAIEILRESRDPALARFRELALPPEPAGTFPGVTLRHGEAVLDGVAAEYVVAPDLARMADATGRRLAELGVPTEGDVPTRIRAAVDALSEPVAVGEGVGAALRALDPYTYAVWPVLVGEWEQRNAGVRIGVGLVLADAPGGGVVVELPTPNGPAWRAGIHAGDVLVEVDGAAVATAAQAQERLAGAPGTPVDLTLGRGRVTLTREAVRDVTVRGARRTADGWDPWLAEDVVLLRISAFRPSTDEELDALLDGLAPAVVILDLRGNGGGDVMSAVNVADRFVADGVLAQLVGRTVAPPQPGPNGELPWNVAVPGHALEGTPLVVLVDRDTASAAEIAAGALRERAGALLVGERTYGKGLAQALRSDEATGVGWQVTNGAWRLPSGAALQEPGGERTGLAPDVDVPLSPGERMLVAELRARREHPPVHADGTPVPYLGTVARPELPRLSEDPQLAAALRVARDRLGP